MSDQLCFCSSQLLFKDCCEPFITNASKPDTCEQLMRSRYSAYVTANIEYLIQTTAVESRDESDPAEMKQWAEQANWIRLEIISSSENQVEFKAFYILGNKLEAIHETSDFIKENDAWVYLDGDAHMHVYDIGRNDLCPCESGKKFKKCCYK